MKASRSGLAAKTSAICWLAGAMSSRSEERRGGKEWRARWSAYHSSKRRHSRYWRDWSSDVCSSDLQGIAGDDYQFLAVELGLDLAKIGCIGLGAELRPPAGQDESIELAIGGEDVRHLLVGGGNVVKIGRATWRERVESSVVGVSFKQKTAFEVLA